MNDVPVELGDNATPLEVASFKNTLSAGDRSTLALAFFLTRLVQDSGLTEKVVVFDDPFNSQDRSRKECTKRRILGIAKRSKQVVVMSHDAAFLGLIWDGAAAADTQSLQLARIGQDKTSITAWDVWQATTGSYRKDHDVLVQFRDYGEGAPRDAVRSIRPVLEGFLKTRFPGEFGENESFGGAFIKRIHEAQSGDALHAARAIIDDFEEFNDFSKKHHHGLSAPDDAERIDDGELSAYIERVLDLVGGMAED